MLLAIQAILGLAAFLAAGVITIYTSRNPTFKRIEEIEREAASRKPKDKNSFLIWRDL